MEHQHWEHQTDDSTGRDKIERARTWLNLQQVPGLTAAMLSRLIRALGGPDQIAGQNMTALTQADIPQRVAAAVLNQLTKPPTGSDKDLSASLVWLEADHHHLLALPDADYPALLRQISDPPPLLYVKGDAGVLNRPAIAMVGSRNSTVYGRDIAWRLSAELARQAYVICSGLASGIDTEAHKAAVSTNSPTVAVLGNGLKQVYPLRNRRLAGQIADHQSEFMGALVSELPLDASPLPSHFPSRNRIISGMSLGVCVVEANLRSGSLITARLALEQNREVFAVPGSINSPRSRGCHELLRQGAVLVESAEDIVSQLESLYRGQLSLLPESLVESEATQTKGSGSLTDDQAWLIRRIHDDPVSTDELVALTGWTVNKISGVLLELELDGQIHKSGGCWQRINR